jgi:peptidoglycan/xylan/chitin deacetylase (PgdA/CDA1 family)
VSVRRRLPRFLPVIVVLALGACSSSGTSQAHWVEPGGHGGGALAGSPGSPDGGDEGGGPVGSPPPTVPGDPAARLPKFGPAPAPQPVTVPAGPNAGWFSNVPTGQKVAFLTIDDGWPFGQLPVVNTLVKAAHVPVTLFLTINAIRNNPGFFKQLQGDGAVIEAHTITHSELKGKSYDFQHREACGSADQLGAWYGRRPIFFRPPFGDKDATTLRVVHDCGMKAAFFWKETVNNGVVRFQTATHVVQPGDILLMHFRPTFVADFLAALQAIHNAGLVPASLEQYVT